MTHPHPTSGKPRKAEPHLGTIQKDPPPGGESMPTVNTTDVINQRKRANIDTSAPFRRAKTKSVNLPTHLYPRAGNPGEPSRKIIKIRMPCAPSLKLNHLGSHASSQFTASRNQCRDPTYHHNRSDPSKYTQQSRFTNDRPYRLYPSQFDNRYRHRNRSRRVLCGSPIPLQSRRITTHATSLDLWNSKEDPTMGRKGNTELFQ